MSQFETLSDIYPLILQYLPSAPAPLIDQHLQQACREFCNRSESWRPYLAAIDTVAAQREYVLVPDWDCELRRVLEVWIRNATDVTNGDKGKLLDESEYDFIQPELLRFTASSSPKNAVTDGLLVRVLLVPYTTQDGNNVISEEFLNKWAEAIQSRALNTLMLMPKQRWTDQALAMYWHGEYLRKVTDAMADVSMDGKNAAQGFSG